MISPPTPGAPAVVGLLAAPDERELEEAYPELRRHALPLSWAAEVLATPTARLVALARAGELLAIPGPWPMRQGYANGLGYLLPAWQFAPGMRRPRPEIRELLAAAASVGWTSLELHRFMTTPLESGTTPTALLQEDDAEAVLALIRGEMPPRPAPRRRRRRLSLRASRPHGRRRRSQAGAR